MDRSLRWRFLALAAIVLYCAGVLAPSVFTHGELPSWFPFSKKISLGLDLQGGIHIVYSIDLDKALDDRASEIKRDIETRLADEKIKGIVKSPELGMITVDMSDPSAQPKRAEIEALMEADYGKTIESCPATFKVGPNVICRKVAASYGDSIKSDALKNAVSTIRERINEKGVAEPSVFTKGDEIVVELPGLDKDKIAETRELISRTAKLEFKVVDDCSVDVPEGCTTGAASHDGSPYMKRVFARIHGDPKKGVKPDPLADELQITAEVDGWRPEEGGASHTDFYLKAHDREETMTLDEAKQAGCWTRESEVKNGKVSCNVTGRKVIDRYLFGEKDRDGKVVKQGLAQIDPKNFQIPDDREIGYEYEQGNPDAKDKRAYWRTYYLDRSVRLTGSSISKASGSYDPNTNRPVVLLDFNRFGGRVFGDITSQIVGMKFATILDDTVKSAPIINTAIRGGRASITMGGNDAERMERERNDLVAVLNTGSIVAPLKEESVSELGPTLGRDAIDKTKLSFALGIGLVILIMVGIYRWSGWIAVFAVVWHIIMTLAVMAIFGATLTLPGIAAIVLSIGMEVDGNILIYERIRDELLLGKSVRGAIDLGFSRAFSAILDGQLTTAAAGWVLLQYGSGPIKGFAVMLLVGVFTTLTTNIWVTRIFFDWTVARKKGTMATISI